MFMSCFQKKKRDAYEIVEKKQLCSRDDDEDEDTSAQERKPRPHNSFSQSRDSHLISAATLQHIDTTFKSAVARREIILEADKLFCAEIFRFLAAMIDWQSILDPTQLKMSAYKIISTFVEVGSRYETHLSPRTRQELIDTKTHKKRVLPALFDAAKVEIIRDILQNPTLKALLNNSNAGSGVYSKSSRQSIF